MYGDGKGSGSQPFLSQGTATSHHHSASPCLFARDSASLVWGYFAHNATYYSTEHSSVRWIRVVYYWWLSALCNGSWLGDSVTQDIIRRFCPLRVGACLLFILKRFLPVLFSVVPQTESVCSVVAFSFVSNLGTSYSNHWTHCSFSFVLLPSFVLTSESRAPLHLSRF
jgi:hypothetical protein